MKRIHFVGIKGVAMAALAIWYKEAGHHVTGSDVEEEFPTDEVLAQGGITTLKFNPKNIANIAPDLVIYTGAHGGKNNDEVVESIAKNIPVLPHGKALGEIMKNKKQISIAGSHGKTTTSAMIATILSVNGYDPSWAIGCGEIRGLGLPGHFGKGDIFVAEADEYVTDPQGDRTPRFMWQRPDILVVTNIDYDHPDVYASIEEVKAAFSGLEKQSAMTIHSKDIQVSHITYGQERTFFTLVHSGMNLWDFMLKVPGKHNAQNAATAAMVAKELGLSWEQIAKGLLVFEGTKRRFEFVGTTREVKVIDDYAHHPNEIKATLEAARSWYPKKRIIVVFQPHTYSRTTSLFSEFAHAFRGADEVILTDIYASARETKNSLVSTKLLVEETARHHANVYYAPDFLAVKKMLEVHMAPHDIIIFMGAGDIYGWSREFCKK